jgi:hypothetical protein
MNIRSVQAGVVSQPPSQPASQAAAPQQDPAQAAGDTFQAAQKQTLVNMLQQQPDVRPDAVERAKALASNPNYPGLDTITSLAKLFIANPGEE